MTTIDDVWRAGLLSIASPSTDDDLSRYRADPVLYAHERLGVEDILPHQCCLLYAIAGRWELITPEMATLAHLENPGTRRIAVRSGQKTGKSWCYIAIALWFFECFEFARALMTATIGDQIRSVLWHQLHLTLNAAAHKPPEEPSEDPARGLVSRDKTREVRGFTGRTIEAVAGISGNLLYLVDEASHLEKKKYEALDGNTAGGGDLGAPIVFASQGTKNEGPFFDAFHSKSHLWTTMQFSSLEIAQYQARTGRRVKGMATLEWCEAKLEEYGADSVFYILRVLGGFVLAEAGKIVPMHLLAEARGRWPDASDVDGDILDIGYDPAGEGDSGDEHGFAAVRGMKCLEIRARRGFSDDRALEEIDFLIDQHRRPADLVRVKIDAEGEIGSRIYGRLRGLAAHRRIHDPARGFVVYGVRTSSKFVNDPLHYVRVRDEVWANVAKWIKAGGSLPHDHKLEEELYQPEWTSTSDGRIFATPKKLLKESLGRSPDRADALCLATDPPRTWRPAQTSATPQTAAPTGASADANAWGYGGGAPTDGGADPNAWGYER